MNYRLIPAGIADEAWLERLRRSVYQELFRSTFGRWEEARHARHFEECWGRGNIAVIELAGERVGMIQLREWPHSIEIDEIQIRPAQQNLGLGTRVLKSTIDRAHAQGRTVRLSVGLKNERALRLYERLGFRRASQTQTHDLLSCEPPLNRGNGRGR
jgi:ribosomal protein S18 acetylase RimI-like enzyme